MHGVVECFESSLLAVLLATWYETRVGNCCLVISSKTLNWAAFSVRTRDVACGLIAESTSIDFFVCFRSLVLSSARSSKFNQEYRSFVFRDVVTFWCHVWCFAQIFEDRERVLYQMSRPACKMLVAKINHKMLKYAFRKWAVVRCFFRKLPDPWSPTISGGFHRSASFWIAQSHLCIGTANIWFPHPCAIWFPDACI